MVSVASSRLDLGAVTVVRIDPDHHLLIQRYRGVFQLELRAPQAKTVQINGDFTSKSLPATLIDGVWKADLPLTALFLVLAD